MSLLSSSAAAVLLAASASCAFTRTAAAAAVDPDASCATAVAGGRGELQRAQAGYARLYQGHRDASRELESALASLDEMDARLRSLSERLADKRARVSDADDIQRLDKARSENREARARLETERGAVRERLARHRANAKACAAAGRAMERLSTGRSQDALDGREPGKAYVVGAPRGYPVAGQHGNTCAIAAALPLFRAWGRPDVTEDDLFAHAWRKGDFTRPAKIACATPAGKTGRCTWETYTGPDGKERVRVLYRGELRYEKPADSFIRDEMRQNGGTPRSKVSRLLVDYGLVEESGREQSSYPLSQIAADTGLVDRQRRRLQDALRAGKAVFVGVDAGSLWNDRASVGGGHALLLAGIREDARGNIMGYYLNDSGDDPPKTGKFYPRDAFETAWLHGGLALTTARRKE